MGRGRQPIRAKILMSTGRPHHFGHLLQVSNKSLQPLTLYTSFHDLINVYKCIYPQLRADNPRGQKFDDKHKPLVTSVICYRFQKISLKSDFIHIFFYDFIHAYSPGTEADNPFKFLSWIWLLFHRVKWANIYFMSAQPRMKYKFFHFTRWNKSHIHDKKLNLFFLYTK